MHSYYYPHGLGDPVDLSDGSGLIPNRGVFADVFVGAFLGWPATVPSLARWGHALLGGGLLSPSSLRAMTRFHDMPSEYGYGLGLYRDDLDGHLCGATPVPASAATASSGPSSTRPDHDRRQLE